MTTDTAAYNAATEELSITEPTTKERVAAEVKAKWQYARDGRFAHERRWLKAQQYYRGEYDSATLSRIEGDDCRIFVKITKTKVIAGYGQLIDVIFSSGNVPIAVESTPLPEGIAEVAHLTEDEGGQEAELPEVEDKYGFAGDGNIMGATGGITADPVLSGLSDTYGGLSFKEGKGAPAKPGAPGPDGKPTPGQPAQPTIFPAKIAAANMQKLIADQMIEGKAGKILRHSLFEMALMGTGITKGPFTETKVQYIWGAEKREGDDADSKDRGRTVTVNEKEVPALESVSIWNGYPDPDCTSASDMSYFVQRHLLSKPAMYDLNLQPAFDPSAIDLAVDLGPNHIHEWWETQLEDSDMNEAGKKWEVLEYWGYLDKKDALRLGVGFDTSKGKYVQVNIWICGDIVLRAVKNPFIPTRIPYNICPYELHPYQIWGVGIAENMMDSQEMMNGFARMAVDNLKLAGNVILDIDKTFLEPGTTFDLHAGKVFLRDGGGMAGQAVHAIKIPNTAPANIQLFDKFRMLADEQTGIQSYSHGQTGVAGTTRTASGMSMLMSASSLSTKTVIKNLDDYLLQPLGESLYHWNMQYNPDIMNIRGDYEVKATGTSSLMQKEVKSQRLLQFMQITAANQMMAPFVKWDKLLARITESLDLDSEDLINTPDEAAIYSKLLGKLNEQAAGAGAPGSGDPSQMGGSGSVPNAGPGNGSGGDGGGQIGAGAIQVSGEAGDSSNDT